MRVVAAAFAVVALAGPACGQQMPYRVLDLAFRSLDLDFRVLDLQIAEAGLTGAATDLVVKETDTEIRIELSADVLFDFDRSDIKPEAAAALAQVAEVLRQHPDQPVRIEGHTDSKGSDSYNQSLSEDRALSVGEWLTEEAGLDGSRFDVVGFGETRPAAPNERANGSDDPEGRQKNRRVEIVIGKTP